jgi:ParB/RepB/Spo0J family partition protein
MVVELHRNRLPSASEVVTAKCHPDPNNQRKLYELDGLKASIAREGILQPIGLRFDAAKDCYFALYGNSRLLCAIDLGLPTVPARVWDRLLTRLEIAKFQAAENLARTELRPSERGATFRELMALENLTAKEVAEQWGISPASVSRYLTLVEQPPDIISLVDQDLLPLSTVAALGRIPEEEIKREMIEQIREGKLSRTQVESAVQAKLGKRPSKAKAKRASFRVGDTVVSFASPADLTLPLIMETVAEFLKRARRAPDLGALASSLATLRQEVPLCSH